MKKWFKSVVHDYELEPHHLQLLRQAAEAWDLSQAAREVLAAEGSTCTDRFGQLKARPEAAMWRDAAAVFSRAVRELQLDAAAPESRPPRMY